MLTETVKVDAFVYAVTCSGFVVVEAEVYEVDFVSEVLATFVSASFESSLVVVVSCFV
jgi:hypothetical protein